jgi:hypothetical protein
MTETEKLDGLSKNSEQEAREKLKSAFPDCLVEGDAGYRQAPEPVRRIYDAFVKKPKFHFEEIFY